MIRMPCGCYAQVDGDGAVLAFEALCRAAKSWRPPIHPLKVRAHFGLRHRGPFAVRGNPR